MELRNQILFSGARHALAVYATTKLASENPIEQALAVAALLIVFAWAVLDKVKVKKLVDGYEITIQQAIQSDLKERKETYEGKD